MTGSRWSTAAAFVRLLGSVSVVTRWEPTLGELIVGVECLALLRLLYAEAAESRAARRVETRELLERLDRDRSSASPVGVELDLHAGYAVI